MDTAHIVATIGVMRVLVVVSMLGCFISACDGECEQPSYAGDATDEVYRVMLDARGTAKSSGDLATFTSPEDGGAVEVDVWPEFTWDSPLKLAAAPSTSSPAWRRPAKSLLRDLSSLFIPQAHAHLPPITSDVYLLEVDVPGRACPVAGLTTELSFVFPEDAWSVITDGGGARTARLLSAFVTDNRVTEGAFIAAPVTFTIE